MAQCGLFTRSPAMHRIPGLPLSLALATLLAGAPFAAFAQTPQHIEIRASADTTPSTEARGRYALSDGRTLELSASGRALSADLGNGRSHRLQPAGANRWASADGRLQVQLTLHANGVVDGLVLTEWRGDAPMRIASR
jgi:hypothetical protein